MEFTEAVKRRRSIRKYDPNQPICPEKVRSCLELATLAPNSSNMQLWEFYHVTSQEVLKKLSNYCFGQNAAKTAQQMVVFAVRKDMWRQRVKAHIENLKDVYGDPTRGGQSKRARFAMTYYTKIVPVIYADFFGLFGYLKYIMYWVIGLFRPVYRQARRSDIRIVAHKSAALAAQTFMLAMSDINYDTCPMEGIDSLRIKKLLDLPRASEINMVVSCGIRLPEGVYGERFRIPFEQVYQTV